MLAKLKAFFTRDPVGKAIEHYAVTFFAVFALTAIATAEHLASTHSLQLSWSLVAGLLAAGAQAGYQAIRPAIVKALTALTGKD
jgi:hypothetical protein